MLKKLKDLDELAYICTAVIVISLVITIATKIMP